MCSIPQAAQDRALLAAQRMRTKKGRRKELCEFTPLSQQQLKSIRGLSLWSITRVGQDYLCRPSTLSVSTDTRHRADLLQPRQLPLSRIFLLWSLRYSISLFTGRWRPPLYCPNLLSPIHSEVDVGGAQVVDVKPDVFWETVPDQVLVLVLVFPHVQHMPVWESRRNDEAL